MRLVLDAEAVTALLDARHPGERMVRQAMQAARRLARDVVIPTVTLAELYRGAGHNQALDALLAREHGHGLLLRDTDRALARLVGALLTEADAGSEQLADAHAVAVAVEVGGAVVATGDPNDLARLAAHYRTVVIQPVTADPAGRQRGGPGRR